MFGLRIEMLFIVCILIILLRYNSSHFDEQNADIFKKDKPDVYVSHPDWLLRQANAHHYVTLSILTGFMWYINFVSTPSFVTLRFVWSSISSVLIVKKVYDFYQFGRLLYLIDFCYFANFFFAYALWNVPIDPPEESGEGKKKSVIPNYNKDNFPNVAQALFCVMNGPVGGGTFMLGTALVFHHPDAYGSFWLHVIPMWFTYGLRWYKFERLLSHSFPDITDVSSWRKRSSMWASIKYIYIPWVISHALFLCIHPYTPLNKYETLFDWVAHGGLPETRDDPVLTWVGKVLAYCCVHFIMAFQGILAAALAFKYQLVHFVWICAVLFNCAYSGFWFYENTIHPPEGFDVSGALGLTDGLKRSLVAWSFMIPAYLYCSYNPTKAPIARSEIKKRAAEKKERKAEEAVKAD